MCGLTSPHSERDCVNSLRSSYMGLHPQTACLRAKLTLSCQILAGATPGQEGNPCVEKAMVYSRNPSSDTGDRTLQNTEPDTPNQKPGTRNMGPETQNPKLKIQNPKPFKWPDFAMPESLPCLSTDLSTLLEACSTQL